MTERIGKNRKVKIDKHGYKRDERGRFAKGTKPGPGRKYRDFITDFKAAAKDIAKRLRIKNWEEIYVELIKAGIKHGLKGNYNFWKDLAERIYGKETEKVDLTSAGKPILGGLSRESRENDETHNSNQEDQ